MECQLYPLSGVVFGLAAGVSPGPLLTLVVSETLRHGVREGIKICVAPLITDLPIVLGTLFLVSHAAEMGSFLGWTSILGAAFLAYLSYGSIAVKAVASLVEDVEPRSFRKGALANLLNPHPYMFWSAVGAPTLLNALHIGFFTGLSFILGFYLSIVGSKTAVALLVGKSRSFLGGRMHLRAIRLMGLALLAFAVLFLMDGLRLLGVIRN